MWYQDNHWSNYKLGIFFFDNKLLNGIINKKKAFDQFLLRQLEDQLSFTLRPIKRNIETCVFRDIIRCLLDQTLCFGHGLVWFLINMLSSSHLQQLIRPTFFPSEFFRCSIFLIFHVIWHLTCMKNLFFRYYARNSREYQDLRLNTNSQENSKPSYGVVGSIAISVRLWLLSISVRFQQGDSI